MCYQCVQSSHEQLREEAGSGQFEAISLPQHDAA